MTPNATMAETLESLLRERPPQALTPSGNGTAGAASQSRPQRPRKGKPKGDESGDESDDFVAAIEAPPEIVEPGIYDVKVERLERWEFYRGKKGERQPKITFWCVLFGGQCNGIKLPMRMNFDVPIRRSSKLWETITVATFPDVPRRVSRISLKKLFIGRLFRAEVRILVSPYRDKGWKPILGNDGQSKERARASVIDCFVEALTGYNNDYLL